MQKSYGHVGDTRTGHDAVATSATSARIWYRHRVRVRRVVRRTATDHDIVDRHRVDRQCTDKHCVDRHSVDRNRAHKHCLEERSLDELGLDELSVLPSVLDERQRR